MFLVVMFRDVLIEHIIYSGSFLFGCYPIICSLALNKRFNDAPGELDYPLEVEIVDDLSVSLSRVHRGCTPDLFR